jgi:Uncharacterised nucleotidyltransferase
MSSSAVDSVPEFNERGLFPSRAQFLVLTAALADGERALGAYAEWRASLDLAADFDREVFRLIPLLFENLRRLGVEDDLSGRLRGAYRMSWVKVHKLATDTMPIVDALVRAGLPLFAVKGAPLGQMYYRNPALRPMSDYDLVVAPQDVQRALEIVAALGYEPWQPVTPEILRYRHAMGFKRADGHELDLHWHVLFDFCDADADLWFASGDTRCELLGHMVRVPDSTRMLLHVLIHGMRWNPEPPIRWVADAMIVLRNAGDRIDWPALVAFAERRGVCRRTWLALAYLRSQFDASIPDFVLQRLARGSAGWLERLESRTILRDEQRVFDELFGPVLLKLAEYSRYAHGEGPWRFALGLSHYLRYSWGLSGRRDIAGYLGHHAARRCRRLIDAI